MLIAEPVHGTGYLPLYIGMAKNLFDDVKVNIVTIETGSGHTNAVLSGQAFAFIGGPEHCAFAKVKGAELRCVVNCVDRGNVYFCAASDAQPTNKDWPSYVKGKTIATSGFGGTPNSITRYLLKKWDLDPTKDVTLVETANSAILPVVKNKQAQIGCSTEPFITQGVRNGAWGEPFINIPKELGPYAYSTFNVRLDSIQKTPELVAGFVRGMMKSLKFVAGKSRRSRRTRAEAVSDHGARRSQSHARPLVRRRDVEQGRHGQPRRLGYRKVRGHERRYSQNRCRL